jgi:uncharacterized protein YndB with AHSA1/START domain
MDVRPGGVWRFIMHAPDGTAYNEKVVYHEVTKPQRLVYTHGSDDENDPEEFLTTVTFEDRGGQTEVTMTGLFQTPQARDRVVEFGAIELGRQTLNHLAEYLATIRR